MSFNTNRINPNQIQVAFKDGRFETLTNEELEELLSQHGLREKTGEPESDIIN
jgi:AMMECR1 domain-containing protein